MPAFSSTEAEPPLGMRPGFVREAQRSAAERQIVEFPRLDGFLDFSFCDQSNHVQRCLWLSPLNHRLSHYWSELPLSDVLPGRSPNPRQERGPNASQPDRMASSISGNPPSKCCSRSSMGCIMPPHSRSRAFPSPHRDASLATLGRPTQRNAVRTDDRLAEAYIGDPLMTGGCPS